MLTFAWTTCVRQAVKPLATFRRICDWGRKCCAHYHFRGVDMNLFQRYLAEEFAEDYEEGRLSRRDALKLIASVTGSLVVANSILASCAPPPESVATSAPTDVPPATDP